MEGRPTNGCEGGRKVDCDQGRAVREDSNIDGGEGRRKAMAVREEHESKAQSPRVVRVGGRTMVARLDTESVADGSERGGEFDRDQGRA